MSAPARLGVIVAGGASRRMPGGKAGALLGGCSLLDRAITLVARAGLDPVVAVRAGTALPQLTMAAAVWTEPTQAASPHPLRGIAAAVRRARAPVVVLPVDLPFLPVGAVTGLACAPASAVLGVAGRPAALVARVEPELADGLDAAADAGARALTTLTALGAAVLDLSTLAPGAGAERALLNVNDPATLAAAERQLAAGSGPTD
ncbi:MAG: NTP transferase domain-containing protein [Patulibacter minatonensis]